MKVFFRVDANEVIATGHMSRCRTVAAKVEKLGCDVAFIVSDKRSMKMLEDTEYEKICLDTSWDDMAYEVGKVTNILLDNPDSTLVIDSYYAYNSYVEALNCYCRTVVFDDLFEEKYQADVIINYNLYSSLFDYSVRYGKEGHRVQLLLGGDFVPLRDEFRIAAKPRTYQHFDAESRRCKLLLMCGGGDNNNTMGQILNKLRIEGLLPLLDITVIAGLYNKNYSELCLYKDIDSRYQVDVMKSVDNVAQIMSNCDICISAASTVLYECCAMGIPTIFYKVAQNQKYDKICFTEDDLMLYGGDMYGDSSDTLDNICRHLELLMESDDLQRTMSNRMMNVVDGLGAKRIAEVIAMQEG